jgi:outer membrane immunogenic protein
MHRVFGMGLATAIAGSAMAADLSVTAPPPVLVYNWTGIYGGVNGGGAWGQQDPFNILTNRFDHDSINFSGGTVGGTAGAQIQLAHVVLGFETDLDWAGIRGSSVRTPSIFGVPAGFSVNATTNVNWDLTARTRLGYARDNYLFYATVGLAVLGAKTNLSTLSGLTSVHLALSAAFLANLNVRAPINGSAGHSEQESNMALPRIGARSLNIAIPPRPHSNSHTSTRCWWV